LFYSTRIEAFIQNNDHNSRYVNVNVVDFFVWEICLVLLQNKTNNKEVTTPYKITSQLFSS